jgi:hypothetical protein
MMSFLAVQRTDLSDGHAASGYKIFFSPIPDDLFPAVWLDLHIGGEFYQDCEDDHLKKEFQAADGTGRRWIRIGPREGVRLYTEEVIGIDAHHTAVVTNIASRAKHGLIVAPGKIDPGFNPTRLVLVVFNQSRRSCRLHVADKIASIAFAETTGPCAATPSRGHLDGTLSDFDQPLSRRVRRWAITLDYRKFSGDLLRMCLVAALTLFAAWLMGALGIRKP